MAHLVVAALDYGQVAPFCTARPHEFAALVRLMHLGVARNDHLHHAAKVSAMDCDGGQGSCRRRRAALMQILHDHVLSHSFLVHDSLAFENGQNSLLLPVAGVASSLETRDSRTLLANIEGHLHLAETVGSLLDDRKFAIAAVSRTRQLLPSMTGRL